MQDKGRGVVIMNHEKYVDKCYTIVDSSQLTKRDQDPTCYSENMFQNIEKNKIYSVSKC